MKILCPKCEAEHDTENAVAGMIRCGCGEWFGEPRPVQKFNVAPVQTRKPVGKVLWVWVATVVLIPCGVFLFLFTPPWLFLIVFLLTLTLFAILKKK